MSYRNPTCNKSYILLAKTMTKKPFPPSFTVHVVTSFTHEKLSTTNCFLYLFSKEASCISGSYGPWTILARPSAEKAAQLGHDSLHRKHRLCPFPAMLSVQKPAECLDLSQQEAMNHKDKAQLLWHPLRVCSRGKAGPKTMPSLAPLQAS